MRCIKLPGLLLWSARFGLSIAILLTGCTVPTLLPVLSSESPSANSSAAPVESLNPTPTAPTATLPTRLEISPSPAATLFLPTTLPPGDVVKPFTKAANFYSLEWSPDGRYLVYVAQDSEQHNRSYGGEGSLAPVFGETHIREVLSEKECTFSTPSENGLSMPIWLRWLAESRMATLNPMGRPVAKESPCQAETQSLTAAEEKALLDGSFMELSPTGAYRMETVGQAPNFTTTVIDTTANLPVGAIDWMFSAGGLGDNPSPQWLSADQFLLPRSDAGPVLVAVSAGLEATAIAPEFFNLPGSNAMVSFAPSHHMDTPVHLLLHVLDSASADDQIRLYHPENQSSEILPFSNAAFSPAGDWLDLQRSPIYEGYESYERWTRPVDPIGSEASLIASILDENYPGYAPGWQSVAIASQPTETTPAIVRVMSIPDGKILQTWTIEDYRISQFFWSPDLSRLAVVGYRPGEQDQALFLLPLQNSP